MQPTAVKAGYVVYPNEPRVVAEQEPLFNADTKLSVGIGGCVMSFLIYVFVFIALVEAIMPRPNWDAFFGIGLLVSPIVAFPIAIVIAACMRRRNLTKLYDEQKKQNHNESQREAAALTFRLNNILTESVSLHSQLPAVLTRGSRFTSIADEEYSANAFAPFWDAVENAAHTLAEYQNISSRLERNANDYYFCLNGRKHTFPGFPVRLVDIPDPTAAIDHLYRAVRVGQTNFQFANIWEHRRTRQVMIAGFRTLGKAITNLGEALNSSLLGLQQAISSDMARLVEEQINSRNLLAEEEHKTRSVLNQRAKEHGRMLDNLQRNRKPL